MLEPMIPDEDQKAIIDSIVSNNSGGFLLASDPGTGKTLVCSEAIKGRGARTVLVIGPLQTRGIPLEEDSTDAEGWNGTIDRQRVGLPFRQIDSTVPGKKALADLQWKVPGVYFVGQELFVRMGWHKVQQFKRDGTPMTKFNEKKGHYEEVFKKERTTVWDIDVDMIIFDEVHRASNGASMTHKTLMGSGVKGKLAPRGFKIGASGTYEGNTFEGAWAVTRWLWPHIIDASVYVWRSRWAATEYDHFAVRNERVVGEKNPGAFVASLPGYARTEANFNIEVRELTLEVELSPEQRRVYDEYEAQMVAWIKDNPSVVKYPVTKRIRQRQVTLGMPTLTWNEDKQEFDVGFEDDCESVKIDKMFAEVLPKGKFFDGETALIYTDSQQFARVMTARINAVYGEGSAREWSGKISRKQRNADKADFLKGEYKYFVAVIAAVGTGTDLLQKVCRNMLYVSSSDSRIDNKQSRDRSERRGQFSSFIRVCHILAKDTVDSGQLSKQMKEALAANLRQKMRRK